MLNLFEFRITSAPIPKNGGFCANVLLVVSLAEVAPKVEVQMCVFLNVNFLEFLHQICNLLLLHVNLSLIIICLMNMMCMGDTSFTVLMLIN